MKTGLWDVQIKNEFGVYFECIQIEKIQDGLIGQHSFSTFWIGNRKNIQ